MFPRGRIFLKPPAGRQIWRWLKRPDNLVIDYPEMPLVANFNNFGDSLTAAAMTDVFID